MVRVNLGPQKGSKIVVAMSGGVDSSVSAGWLKEQGFEVIGVSLHLHDVSEVGENTFGTCCSPTDISDARRVAQTLGIPFYVANMEEMFKANIIDNFIHEYLAGRTPNPCIRCNEIAKFHYLREWALDLGAEYLATGHYASTRFDPESERFELLRGQDPEKDQSYFLFSMKQKDLRATLFPVGQLEKQRVRDIARKLNLPVADKAESQEICFVQEKNYKSFIESRVAPSLFRKGLMRDTSGKVVGEHSGVYQFTIGQRKGLGVQSLEPLYVVSINRYNNEVIVGPEEALLQKKCTAAQCNWIAPPNLQAPQKYTAKIRYRAKDSPVEVFPLLDNRMEVHFNEPQRAITPGQALVLYDKERVIGGGWIEDREEYFTKAP